jgi:signal transduction histidine kinase
MSSKTKKKQNALTIFPILTKLIIVMLVVLGGILSFVIYQESNLDLQNTLNILEQEGARLIFQIGSYKELMAFLEDRDTGAARPLQEEFSQLLREEDHLAYIQLVNGRGEMLLEDGELSAISSTCYDHLMFSLINDQQITHTYKDPQSGKIIFEIIEPIEPFKDHVRGKTIGAVRLGLFLDKARSQISFTRKSHFYNLSIFMVTALIVGIIAFYILIARNSYKIINSALKEAEEINRAIMEKMRQSARLSALGEFSAGIAHEIRNPLTSIKTFTQLLQTEYEDPNFRKEFVDSVTREVNRINRIVNDLLDYSRPRADNRQATDIAKLVDETLASVIPAYNEHHITIKKNYNQTPPVVIDPEQVRQVLVNLVINAVEAMPSGGSITCTIRENKGEAEIEIADTGKGIPEDTVKQIFTPFFTTKVGGTGLGLSIVQRIVNEQGGRIEVASSRDQGTQFKLFLPMEKDEREENTNRG